MRISDWSSDVCSSDLRKASSAPPPDMPRERIVRIDPEDRLWVDLFLGYVARGCAQPGGYPAFYEAMDRKRYDVCQELCISLTFYMARGQFGADRKKRNGLAAAAEIGRASCRERVWPCV